MQKSKTEPNKTDSKQQVNKETERNEPDKRDRNRDRGLEPNGERFCLCMYNIYKIYKNIYIHI